jgi:diaminopimelate epimerase
MGGVESSSIRFKTGGNVGIGTANPSSKLQVEEYGIDTTETSTTATTQVAIHTMSATAFRSARFTVQVTNSTDSTYHLTEILMIHDGTTPSITEYGTIFTGSAEATFDADISSGNVRLLATPASTDTMEFKVVAHSITT